MTRPTVADLRAVLGAEAEDVSPAADVLARVPAERGRPRRHPTIMIAAAVVATLLAGVLIAVLRDTRSPNEASPPTTWRTFSSPSFGFGVRYPSTWRRATFEEVSSFTAAIVFFSDQPMVAPCTTSADGGEISCRGGAVTHLAPGGVAVEWSNNGWPSDPYPRAVGTPTTIGGIPAKVDIGTNAGCTGIGGRTGVTATVRRPDAANNVLIMNACVAAGRDSREVALVLESLRSMRQR